MGLEIRRKRQHLQLLQGYGIQTVLDIGANSGQFACQARRLLPRATIHSFEPLPDVLEDLKKRMAGDALFFAHGVALGDKDSTAVIYRNEFTPSSSLRPLGEVHLRAFPEASRVEAVTVRCCTLDGWADGQSLEGPLLIKLDVQGYEDRVIQGGVRTIPTARVAVVEVSFVELYRGQKLFDSQYEALRGLGFRCIGMVENVYEPASGRILQADALFEKE
jgi:FkbM family methyltransferase